MGAWWFRTGGPGTPLASPETMSAIARAAELGGAAGIRAEGMADIRAVKDAVGVPVIGLVKRDVPGLPRPDHREPRGRARCGGRRRRRGGGGRDAPHDPDGMATQDFLAALSAELEAPLLGDVDSFESAAAALAAGADAVATTLSGYTGGGSAPEEPDLELLERLAAELDCPVLAEGRYWTPDDVAAAFDAGAWAVVVGTAISDPTVLTRRLAEASARSRADGTPR